MITSRQKLNITLTKTFAMLSLLSGVSLSGQAQPVEPEWKLTFKNAYIERNFDSEVVRDSGSWSQSASLFYTSHMKETPVSVDGNPVTIGVNASTQYAVRLSSDKHVSDGILPFDPVTQTQAADYFKYGATLKLNRTGFVGDQLS